MMTPPALPRPPDGAVTALVLLFFVGIYLGISANLPGGIPVPAVIAGAAGCLILLAEGDRVRERQLVLLAGVLALYALSILSASDVRFLGERFKGLLQLTYSMLIGYGVFLALTQFNRRRLAAMMLAFVVFILVGALLENLTPFRAVSDAFRSWAFDSGVYTADLRDQAFYSLVRPKVFTSEPSAVAFMFSLFAFTWYTMSKARLKLLAYLGIIAVGYYLMRGPTLLVSLALVPAYELLLASRRGPPGNTRLHVGRVTGGMMLALLAAAVAIPLVQALYPERVNAILLGRDPSFFSRIVAPPMVAWKVILANPAAGAGLTGWEFIEDITRQVYATSTWLSTDYRFSSAAKAITNYFWLHWIYLGLLWGAILAIALTALLRTLGVASIAFCWIMWAVFGQGSGSYVGPQAWTVFFLGAAITVIHERERVLKLFTASARAARAVQQEPWLARPTAAEGTR